MAKDLQEQIADLKQELEAANQLNAELNSALSSKEKNAGKNIISIDGKDYEVVTPKFNLDSVDYEAKDLATNKELAKAVLGMEGQNIVKLAEAPAEAAPAKTKKK